MQRILILFSALAIAAACAREPQAPPAQSATAGVVAVADKSAAPTPTATVGAVETPPAADDQSHRGPEYRELTIPAGTILLVDLETPVASDSSRVEQPVHGKLRRPVVEHGVQVLPAGAAINGHVTAVRRPGRVKGRAYVAMRFTELATPGEGATRIRTAAVGRLGRTTKGKDAIEVLGPAAAGAVIGRVAGGKGAARKGALIGGAGGAGYVLATRGEEVRLGPGANLAVRLTSPVTVRVPMR